MTHNALDKLDFIILDTNQYAKKKDSIVLIDEENEPQHVLKNLRHYLKGKEVK